VTSLDVVGMTHRGLARDHNEDTIAIGGYVSSSWEGEPVRLRVDSDRPVPCLVADGLGGHAEGGRASRLVAAFLSDAWARYGDPDSLTKAVHEANDALYAEMCLSPLWTGMGTTLAGAVFAGGQAICLNVGDSRCFRLAEDATLVAVSVDDSPLAVPGAQADGVVTVVTQTLGGDGVPSAVEPHVYTGATKSGDRFLLCSDGLTDYVPLDAVEERLRAHDDPVSAVRATVGAALRESAPDNVSVVLVTVLG
jgi:PPM family protein phosphatase